ncbi:hypothetical protein BAC2_00374 [uncultured bacterium]|nr:hypothetical protein BAC2_00374 [uncultured bacterium]
MFAALSLVGGSVLADPNTSFTYSLPPAAWSSINFDTAMYRLHLNRLQQNNSEGAGGSSSSEQVLRKPQAGLLAQSTRYTPAIRDGDYAHKLADAYPAQSRGEAERVFKELLSGYRKLEARFGIPRNDVAGSIAAFLAGSYMAYHDTDFPDEHFRPLVEQMRTVVGSNADFARATEAEKQEMYEKMAMLGMYMATTQMALKEQPNPQVSVNMKKAAKTYLEQFLKADADSVEITARGLVIR